MQGIFFFFFVSTFPKKHDLHDFISQSIFLEIGSTWMHRIKSKGSFLMILRL